MIHISVTTLDIPFGCVVYIGCALPNTLFPIMVLEKENIMFSNGVIIGSYYFLFF